MSMYDKARELANEVLETKEAKKMLEMNYILTGDTEAQEKLDKFTKLKKEFHHSKNLSEEEIDKKQKEIKEASNQVKEDKVLSDYFLAQKEFTKLVNSVMDIFNATLFGEFEDDEDLGKGSCCGGGCSGCSGC